MWLLIITCAKRSNHDAPVTIKALQTSITCFNGIILSYHLLLLIWQIKTTIIQDQIEPGDKLRLISHGKLLEVNLRSNFVRATLLLTTAASQNKQITCRGRWYERNQTTTNSRDTGHTFTQQKDNETLQESGVHDNAIIDCSITKFAVLRALATEISLDESNTSNVRSVKLEIGVRTEVPSG